MAFTLGDAKINIGADHKTLNKSLGDAERKFKGSFGNIEKLGARVGTAMTRVGTVITGAFAVAVKRAVDFETAFTDVQRVVSGSEEDFKKLSDGLKEMSERMPHSAAELANIMKIAGQMGVRGVENLLDFTETLMRLADATGIVGEEGALQFAQFLNLFQTVPENVDKVASAIAQLGDDFPAMERDILNIASQLAAMGTQVGLTEANVLALATAISSSGGEAEAASSSFQRIGLAMKSAVIAGTTGLAEFETQAGMSIESLQKLADGGKKTKDQFEFVAKTFGVSSKELKEMLKEVSGGSGMLETFARLSGVSMQQFAETFRNDPMQAMLLFIQGLNNINEAGGDVAVALAQLELADIRVTRETGKVIATLTGEAGLERAMKVADEAIGTNQKLMDDSSRKYETFASKLGMTRNQLDNMAADIGKNLLPTLLGLLNSLKPIIDRFSEWAKKNPELLETIAKVALAMVVTAPFASGLKTIGTLFGGIVTILGGAGVAGSMIGGLVLLAATLVIVGSAYAILSNNHKLKNWLIDHGLHIDILVQKFENLLRLLHSVKEWLNGPSGPQFGPGVERWRDSAGLLPGEPGYIPPAQPSRASMRAMIPFPSLAGAGGGVVNHNNNGTYNFTANGVNDPAQFLRDAGRMMRRRKL